MEHLTSHAFAECVEEMAERVGFCKITLNLADRIQKMPLVKAAFATGALAESAAEGFA